MTITTGLNGASVIVTGGGSGIGAAAVRQFAAAGANLVVADVNADAAQAVADDIVSVGGSAICVVGDLSRQDVVDKVVGAAVEAFGTVDVLVNNAGIMDSMSGPDETSDAEWERVLRVNLTAPFLLTRAVVPLMLSRGKGAIVNTASEASLRGSAAGTAYTVSKHGLVGLTRSAAVMYRGRGIRVNAIAPGATATNIQVDIDPTHTGPTAIGPYMSNVGRVADADETAAVIVFLASDAASDVTGVVLPVDGGWGAV
jgi:NAD(P)-dependent dehydrogenase (short-subunit alcohol dehydrogenase family)